MTQFVILSIGVVVIAAAAVLTLIRMSRGPSTLDRVVSADVFIAIVISGIAMEAALNRHMTTLPVMLVLSLLGFAGSLSIARFVADRDGAKKWDIQEQQPDERPPSERGRTL